MIKSKKGAGFLEVNYIFTAYFFFFIFAIIIGLVIPESEIEEQSFSDVIDELSEDLGTIGGWTVGILLSIGNFIFSIVGVSLINNISILPLWLNSFLSLYSIMIVIFTIGWVVSWF